MTQFEQKHQQQDPRDLPRCSQKAFSESSSDSIIQYLPASQSIFQYLLQYLLWLLTDSDVQTLGVVVLQVGLHLLDDVAVVGSVVRGHSARMGYRKRSVKQMGHCRASNHSVETLPSPVHTERVNEAFVTGSPIFATSIRSTESHATALTTVPPHSQPKPSSQEKKHYAR